MLQFCREDIGEHTCDKRRTRSYIAAHKPHFDIEEGLSEEDKLWHPTTRETAAEVSQRARAVLDKIFESSEDNICRFFSDIDEIYMFYWASSHFNYGSWWLDQRISDCDWQRGLPIEDRRYAGLLLVLISSS